MQNFSRVFELEAALNSQVLISIITIFSAIGFILLGRTIRGWFIDKALLPHHSKQVKTPATPEGEILRSLCYACCEADAHGELSEYIDGALLDRAKLLFTSTPTRTTE